MDILNSEKKSSKLSFQKILGYIFLTILLTISFIIIFTFFHRVNYKVFTSRGYRVEITHLAFWSYFATLPGELKLKPGFVEIFQSEKSLGRMPVREIGNVGLRWTKTGASVPLEGEWDFHNGTCYFWAEDTRLLECER
jgi:hypothetical protein